MAYHPISYNALNRIIYIYTWFPALLSSHSSVEVWKGHNNDLFDLYLSRDSEISHWQGSYSSGKTWKTWKRDFLEKIRENLENSGNFILPNISDQIGCALRTNE